MDYRGYETVNVREEICLAYVVQIDPARREKNLTEPITTPEVTLWRNGEEVSSKVYEANCSLSAEEILLDYASSIGKYDQAKKYIEWANQQEGLSPISFVPIDKSPEQIKWRSWMTKDNQEWRKAIEDDYKESCKDPLWGLR